MNKKILAMLMLATLCFGTILADEVGTWKNYLAYSDVTDIKRGAAGDVFVLASKGLYAYNTGDKSITTFDKTNCLSDQGISYIGWCKSQKKLIIVYDNCNIDIMDQKFNVTNVSDFYTSTTSKDKTINSVFIAGDYAYLACNLGIVKVNMRNCEISGVFYIAYKIKQVGIDSEYLYGFISDNFVIRARLDSNMADAANWRVEKNTFQSLFAADKTDYNELIAEVNTLKPGGPFTNNFGNLRLKNGALYTTGIVSSRLPASIQWLKDGEWQQVDYTDIADKTGHRIRAINAIDVAETAQGTVIAAGGETGLYIFKDKELAHHYTYTNSPLQPAVDITNYINYVLVYALAFDKQGRLWVANTQAPERTLMSWNMAEADNADNGWTVRDEPKMMLDNTTSLQGLRRMTCASDGKLWLVNNHWNSPSVIQFDPESDNIAVVQDFVNQDNTNYPMITSVGNTCEDMNGNVWFGTSQGLFYFTASDIRNAKAPWTCNQHKVPRNDGTNYADYLLDGVAIQVVVVDGANRKWIGTESNGVYLISADNNTQVAHFTTENSPLLSDAIIDIAIDNKTGEAYFATSAGLCSYTADVSEAASGMSKGTVYAFPNPVTPDYNGLVTIQGLTYNADIKITTATGYLVNEGRSNGGTYTWDCTDRQGKRVASGVYNVITATADGQKGTVCKIAVIN